MAVDTIYLKNEQGADVPYQIGADSRNVTYSPNAETVEGSVHKELQQNNIHKNTIIANDTGVHGIRYKDNKLQVQAPGGGWNPIDFGTGDMKKVDYDEPGQDGVIGTEHGGTGNTSGYVRVGAQIGSPIGSGATAEGGNTIASGIASHAEGIESQATGAGSHAEGGSIEEYQGATYIGNGGAATGLGSHAEGSDTTASGDSSHAEGIKSQATGMGSHAEGGYYTNNTSDPRNRVYYPGGTAIGHSSHAEGAGTIARGIASHAEGEFTEATGHYSFAGGRNIVTTGFGSFAHGIGNEDTKTNFGGTASFGIMNCSYKKFNDNDFDGTRFAIQTTSPGNLKPTGGLDGTNGIYFEKINDSDSDWYTPIDLPKGSMYLLFITAEDIDRRDIAQRGVYFISDFGRGSTESSNIVMKIMEEATGGQDHSSPIVTPSTQGVFLRITINSNIKAQCQLIRIA